MNKVVLIGRLTAKPELRYTPNNIATTRFSIAVDRQYSNAQGERGVDFINIVVWRKLAEHVCNYLNKGSRVAIDGRIQTGSYTDKDGNKRYTTEVLADNVQFLETRAQAQARESNPTPYDFVPSNDVTPTNEVNVEEDPFADFGDSVSIDDNFLD